MVKEDVMVEKEIVKGEDDREGREKKNSMKDEMINGEDKMKW